MRMLYDYRQQKAMKEFQSCATTKDTFTRVYERGYWGRSNDPAERYFSGSGSHESEVVNAYLSAVTGFLQSFIEKPDVVDLGCGDFAVGSRIRPYCGRYVAADFVEGLIERNKQVYESDNVDFRALDMINDDLPTGDVVFIRQVLQHLSNNEIQKVVAKLPGSYRFLILTEHLPSSGSFVANVDKESGPYIRLNFGKHGSGVVLTEPPFNLKVAKSTVLCEVFEDVDGRKGLIRTTLCEF